MELDVINPSEDDIKRLEDHLFATDPILKDLVAIRDVGEPMGLMAKNRQEIFSHHTYDLIKKKDEEITKLIGEIANLKDSIFWGNKAHDDELTEIKDKLTESNNEYTKDIIYLDRKIKRLEAELHQQKFNNKHNLSIDGQIADKIESLEQENQILREELISARRLMENL